jgi:hypothetical protein
MRRDITEAYLAAGRVCMRRPDADTKLRIAATHCHRDDHNVSEGLPSGVGERLLVELVRAAQQASPAELSSVLNQYAEGMGVTQAFVYLVDLQQRRLLPLIEGEPDLEVDASLAGWAYRTDSLRVEGGQPGGLTLWLPLIDGAERLGILEIQTDTLDGLKLWRCQTLASLLALVITSKRAYSDTIAQRMRTHPMQLHTEPLRVFWRLWYAPVLMESGCLPASMSFVSSHCHISVGSLRPMRNFGSADGR